MPSPYLCVVARSAPRFNLTGRTFHEQAQVDQWVDFTAFELEPPRNLWIYPLQGLMTIDPKVCTLCDCSRVGEIVRKVWVSLCQN